MPQSGSVEYDTTLFIDTLRMPEEYKQPNIFYYFPDDTSFCVAGPLYNYIFSDIDNNTYFQPFEWSSPYYTNKAPLCLLSYSQEIEDITLEFISQILIYYDRAGEDCGEIYTPTDAVINVNKSISDIQLFPDPVSRILNISSAEEIKSITISDILGQVVYNNSYKNDHVNIDVSGLSAGVYLVKVNSADVEKFVKE